MTSKTENKPQTVEVSADHLAEREQETQALCAQIKEYEAMLRGAQRMITRLGLLSDYQEREIEGQREQIRAMQARISALDGS